MFTYLLIGLSTSAVIAHTLKDDPSFDRVVAMSPVRSFTVALIGLAGACVLWPVLWILLYAYRSK